MCVCVCVCVCVCLCVCVLCVCVCARVRALAFTPSHARLHTDQEGERLQLLPALAPCVPLCPPVSPCVPSVPLCQPDLPATGGCRLTTYRPCHCVSLTSQQQGAVGWQLIIIIIIAFKGAIRDFFTISSQHRELSPTRNAQVAQAHSCVNHVQHIERLSRATCRVTCHLVRRDSSAIKFDRVEIAFI